MVSYIIWVLSLSPFLIFRISRYLKHPVSRFNLKYLQCLNKFLNMSMVRGSSADGMQQPVSCGARSTIENITYRCAINTAHRIGLMISIFNVPNILLPDLRGHKTKLDSKCGGFIVLFSCSNRLGRLGESKRQPSWKLRYCSIAQTIPYAFCNSHFTLETIGLRKYF